MKHQKGLINIILQVYALSSILYSPLPTFDEILTPPVQKITSIAEESAVADRVMCITSTIS